MSEVNLENESSMYSIAESVRGTSDNLETINDVVSKLLSDSDVRIQDYFSEHFSEISAANSDLYKCLDDIPTVSNWLNNTTDDYVATKAYTEKLASGGGTSEYGNYSGLNSTIGGTNVGKMTIDPEFIKKLPDKVKNKIIKELKDAGFTDKQIEDILNGNYPVDKYTTEKLQATINSVVKDNQDVAKILQKTVGFDIFDKDGNVDLNKLQVAEIIAGKNLGMDIDMTPGSPFKVHIDELTMQLEKEYKENPDIRKQIVDKYGMDIFDKNGNVDQDKLALIRVIDGQDLNDDYDITKDIKNTDVGNNKNGDDSSQGTGKVQDKNPKKPDNKDVDGTKEDKPTSDSDKSKGQEIDTDAPTSPPTTASPTAAPTTAEESTPSGGSSGGGSGGSGSGGSTPNDDVNMDAFNNIPSTLPETTPSTYGQLTQTTLPENSVTPIPGADLDKDAEGPFGLEGHKTDGLSTSLASGLGSGRSSGSSLGGDIGKAGSSKDGGGSALENIGNALGDLGHDIMDTIDRSTGRFVSGISPFTGGSSSTVGSKKSAAGVIAAASIVAGGAATGGGILLHKKASTLRFSIEDWESLGADYHEVIENLMKKVGFSEEEIETFKNAKFKLPASELKAHKKKIDKAMDQNPICGDELLQLYNYSFFDENNKVIDYLLFITMIIDGKNASDEYNMYNVLNESLEDESDDDFIYTGISMEDYFDDEKEEEEIVADEEFKFMNDPTEMASDEKEETSSEPEGELEEASSAVDKEWLKGLGIID